MQKVFIDANVLVSRTLRDWLFAFRQPELFMFELYSSLDVITEALHSIRRNKPEIPGTLIDRWRQQMQEIIIMVTDYNPADVKSTYKGSDKDDLHVHAAAVAAQCDYLMTNDRKLYGDLSGEELDELEYEVVSPDEFFCLVAESSPVLLDAAVTSQLRYWAEKTEHPRLDEHLREAECPNFAIFVKRAVMRKAGLPPACILQQCPFPDVYNVYERPSLEEEYLNRITEDL